MRDRRDRRLQHLPPGDIRDRLSRILDQVDLCLKNHQEEVTDFLEPHLVKAAADILRGISNISFWADGGHPEAERKRIVISPDYIEPRDSCICWLVAELQGENDKIGHRDFLGSLLGLGLRREKVGDLKVIENGCAVALDRDVASYVVLQWNQVQKSSIRVKPLADGEVPQFTEKGEETTLTVASLRADALVAAIWHMSRARASETIQKGLLKVNWMETFDGSRTITEKDVLSLRGFGRAVVSEIGGSTKKGRVRLTVWRPVEQ